MSKYYPAVGVSWDAVHHTCDFTVWSPESRDIVLLINNHKYSLQPSAVPGYWHITLAHIQPGDRYQFLVNNEKLLPDPASRFQPEGVHGHSAVVDPSFGWTDHAWKGQPLEEMVIYELHTGTFTSAGTFVGIIDKLPYLRSLGINAIELMPVAAFPGTRNWGYDGVFPFAVQASYGGVQGLKQLVEAAHQQGIAVILDVVYNHLGPEGNQLASYGPYFTEKYRSVWGQSLNYDDAHCDGVRHFFIQNALMWLDEFHIDGLRLDAVHAIWDFSADHFIAALKREVAALEQRTGRKKILIAEIDINNPRYIQDATKGGYGLDGQWIDEFHHALHAVVTGEVNGYYEDFGKPWHIAKTIRDSYVYTGEYSPHRKKRFGVPVGELSYGQFVVFAQNHDQVGNRLAGDRLATQLSFEALKLMAAAVLLSPHVPLLFMGEEYGERNPFQYFISHEDASLVEKVRKGRKEEFAYFNWEGEVPDPQATETFEQCKLSWNRHLDPQGALLFRFYQYLIAFRSSRPAMGCKERRHLTLIDTPEESIVAFQRAKDNDQLLFFMNFSKEVITCSYALPLNARKIFDSAAVDWNGPGESPEPEAHRFTMNPQSVVIYEMLTT